MRSTKILSFGLVVLFLCIPQAFAGDCPKDEMVKAVNYAADLVKTKGKAAFPELELYRFCGKEGYVFICDMNATVLFHAAFKKLVGVNQLSLQDAKGKYFTAEMKAKAEKPGEGWVSYFWANPANGNKIEPKFTYLKTTTMDGQKVFVAAGIYGFSAAESK